VKTVAVTQRVTTIAAYGERRDCLDQAWPKFLERCGLLTLAIPNVPSVALRLCQDAELAGLILTGGNDLTVLGGDAPERDQTEAALLDWARGRELPVIGVCRGMQLIQNRYGVPLQRVAGHVSPDQSISIEGERRRVNSYHCFGARETRAPLDVWAVADDGVIKAVRHTREPILGIMWHPERISPFSAFDLELFRSAFRSAECAA
jgi:N5-(cytidine 5'-diphosphoramidyl)-L-glutamine hydrolase